MSLTDGEYYFFGYANESVKNEFQSFFMSYSTLAKAIKGLLYLGDNLNSRYTFMDNDVKYKMRAKPSYHDDPAKLNEALLRWHIFVERSNYKSMGCVIEKILMVRKEIIRKHFSRACENLEDLKKVSKISNSPDMNDSDGDLQTNTKPSNLNQDDNISCKNGNVPDVQNSDPLSLQAPKEESLPSTSLSERSQNPKSDVLAEYEGEPCIESGRKRALENIFKSEMVEKYSKKLNDEAVLNVGKNVPAVVFAENKSELKTSKDPNVVHAMPISTEVLDDNATKLLSQQLKHVDLEDDAPVGENDMSPIESASEHVTKELTVPSGAETGELETRENSEDIGACEGDSWGTTIAISSDSDSSSIRQLLLE